MADGWQRPKKNVLGKGSLGATAEDEQARPAEGNWASLRNWDAEADGGEGLAAPDTNSGAMLVIGPKGSVAFGNKNIIWLRES
ncbi:uncharacterized protein N7458_007167 [Penicillium daleae]|uniref:Uncharacterized protein n=1 Tax=Penicillium daleae TaxID=63821 RepID=A0AAD6G392_9EURO|nr:uncharacterized protein N7458_007167 [Penicillium daleae]KAJ5450718.1 hypothetical protein N7458_007167 [Penicillium daleae]